jgi:UDP-glucose-4-epimerase GalE
MPAIDRVLVTGGCGFVGSHFVRAAYDAGSQVVVLDDLSAGSCPFMPKGVTFIRGNIADRALVGRTIREHRITAIVHFAGKICVGESVENPALYFDTNVTKTLALLDTVLQEGPGVFVFSSSAAVYGRVETQPISELVRAEPINPYGATKLTIEYALEAYGRAHGIRWAALRYFNACGAHPDGSLCESHDPETHLIPILIDATLGKRAPFVVYGDTYATRDGTCVRDYVHVMDLARAHLMAIDALDHDVQIGPMNLGAGQGHSVREVIETAARVFEAPIPFQIGETRAGDPPTLVANCSHARDLLGWQPERSDLGVVIEDALRSRR